MYIDIYISIYPSLFLYIIKREGDSINVLVPETEESP